MGPRPWSFVSNGALLLIFLGLFNSSGFAQEFIRGDVNGDGRVSITDLVRLIHFHFSSDSSPACPDSADADDDGDLDILDVLSLMECLYGRTLAQLPAPYPTPGLDPTNDDLDPCLSAGETGSGADIDHIYYLSNDGRGAPGFAVFPGENEVRLPIFLDTNVDLSALVLSLRYDADQIRDVLIDFQGTAAKQYGADKVYQVTKSTADAKCYAVGYVLMLLNNNRDAGEEPTIPSGEEHLIANLVFSVSPDLNIGDTLDLRFETAAQVADEPEIPNEVVIPGLRASIPRTLDINVPVVDEGRIFVRGDVNGDKGFSILDPFELLQFLFAENLHPLNCADAADVDDSGELSLSDAIQLLRYLFSGSAYQPAAPFRFSGIDLSEDELGCDLGG